MEKLCQIVGVLGLERLVGNDKIVVTTLWAQVNFLANKMDYNCQQLTIKSLHLQHLAL